MTNAIVRIAEIILEVVVTVVSLVIARFVPATWSRRPVHGDAV